CVYVCHLCGKRARLVSSNFLFATNLVGVATFAIMPIGIAFANIKDLVSVRGPRVVMILPGPNGQRRWPAGYHLAGPGSFGEKGVRDHVSPRQPTFRSSGGLGLPIGGRSAHGG